MRPILGRLCIVTDRQQSDGDPVVWVKHALRAVPPGSALVQLREKDLSASELFQLARRLLPVTHEYRSPLLINDRLDVALAVGADGAHLPEGGLDLRMARRLTGPDFLLGVSTHSVDKVTAATRDGADLLFFGPVYDTPDKRRFGAPQGIVALEQAATAAGRTPLYAIGGMSDEAAVRAAKEAGAYGVAGIRAFIGHEGAAHAESFLAVFQH